MAKRKEIQEPTPGESSYSDWERWIMHTTLSATDWNISQTARVLELGRSTVHRKLKGYSLQPPAGKKFK
jgi:transcriptional regulator of acetoin/glycerol metabolism